MVQGFLDHISDLLHSPEVEVSYFAAGILAHLTSRGQEAWTLTPNLRFSLLEQLVGIKQSWFWLMLVEYLIISVNHHSLCASPACCHYEVAPS